MTLMAGFARLRAPAAESSGRLRFPQPWTPWASHGSSSFTQEGPTRLGANTVHLGLCFPLWTPSTHVAPWKLHLAGSSRTPESSVCIKCTQKQLFSGTKMGLQRGRCGGGALGWAAQGRGGQTGRGVTWQHHTCRMPQAEAPAAAPIERVPVGSQIVDATQSG